MGLANDNTYDAIVIGSGLGGLSCALHLAKKGLHVLVLEKQPKVGGYCQGYLRGDYDFDVSLHILSSLNPEGGLHKLLSYLQVLDKLEIIEHRPMYTSIFPDRSYRPPGGEDAFRGFLEREFPSERSGIRKFVSTMKAIVEENSELFWSGAADFQNFFPSRYFKKSYAELLSECFDEPRLHGLLGQLWQSTGLPNSRCAANWAAEVFGSHMFSGNYYLRGGGPALARAMAETIREAGSVIRCSSLVTKVILQDRRAVGVELESGEDFRAPIIVSNANPIQTYLSLIGKAHLSAPFLYKLDNMERSCSLLTLYLGLDCPGSEAGLTDHTTFINHSYDNDAAYALAMEERYHGTDYMISDYSTDDERIHPKGHGVVQVLEVANGKAWTSIPREAYEKKKEHFTRTLLDKVGTTYPELESHIRVCELGTPRTMQLVTRNPDGAVYGWAQTPNQADLSRFGVKSLFQGLYFTGAWARGGGGGYMGAIINGRIAHTEILATEGLAANDRRIPTRPRAAKEVDTGETLADAEVTFSLTAAHISDIAELRSEAAVRFASEAVQRFADERLGALNALWPAFEANALHVSFFSMRFIFVPFLSVRAGQQIRANVSFQPKEMGKGEFHVDIRDDATGKKLANASGHVLIRKVDQSASREVVPRTSEI